MFPSNSFNSSQQFSGQLDNLVFPMDFGFELFKESDIIGVSPTDSEHNSLNPLIFLAYDAINEPVLLLSNQTLNVIHGNKKALTAFGYKELNDVPIYKLFPEFDIDAVLVNDLCLKSQKGITRKGDPLLYDISIGSIPKSAFNKSEIPSDNSKFWVLTLSKTQVTISNSRFQMEFDKIKMVGKGTFGKVFQVRNRVDQQEYAIKQVRINCNIDKLISSTTSSSPKHSEDAVINHHQKLLREVKTFASLSNHSNVVRYYNAWIESASEESDSESDDSDVEPYVKLTVKTKKSHSLSPKPKYPSKKSSFLYIQMQLCLYNDLRHWIDQRGDFVNTNTNLEILLQILSGLTHIHAQNIVHRDLKPENIFIDGNKVLLGDFGLAKSIENSVPPLHGACGSHFSMDSSNDYGTYLYTAPEIHEHQMCTTKSDIYSFGILFLELFSIFSTGMERAKVLNAVKETRLLPETFRIKYPEEASVIDICLLNEPLHRPSASALLDDSIFHDVIIMNQSPAFMVGNDSGLSYESTIFHRRQSSTFSTSAFSPISALKIQNMHNYPANTPCHETFSAHTLFSGTSRFTLPSHSPSENQKPSSYSGADQKERTVLLESLHEHSKSANLLFNTTNTEIVPCVEHAENDFSTTKIQKLEQDVKALMKKLTASEFREKILEGELSNVLEVVENIGNERQRKLDPPEMQRSGSQPISIPRRKFV